jgi:predicted RNA-binding protein YlxR (DUF448 family)
MAATMTVEGDTAGEPAGKRRAAPERRCLVTGEVRPRDVLMRFVAGPDDIVVPDLDGRLPGRGLWLTGRRDIVAEACAKRAFARGARRNVTPMTGPSGETLEAFVEAELLRRAEAALSMARKAGAFVSGFEKVRAALAGLEAQAGDAAVLICARDAGADGREKLDRLAGHAGALVRVGIFDAGTLGRIAGRERTVHALVLPGPAAGHVAAAARRHAAYCGTDAENDLDVTD